MSQPSNTTNHSRRRFLSVCAQLAAGALVSAPFKSRAASTISSPLSFYHTHTGERLNIEFSLTACTPVQAQKINRFLRDFRTGDIHPIDPRLLDTLCSIQKISHSSGTFEVISGFRSPATNKKLHQSSSGVAKKSLHMEGRAIDIRLTDVPTSKLRTIAGSLQRGGVGYYAKSDFIHLDTGRVRSW